MREYVFLLEYDRGVHPVRDVFIDHPSVVATALDVSIAHDGGWRVERVTGPEHALDAVESVYFDEQCNDCTHPTSACDTTLSYRVIERDRTTRTIYRHVTDMSYCSSLGYLALRSLGDGLVFDTTQRGPYYEWRVLVPSERNVDAFQRALREDLPAGVSLDLRRAASPDRWLHARQPSSGLSLPYEQREAIETARRIGYYEHPREATLETVAAELDVPLTTLRYRLRRAEAWATEFALAECRLGFDGATLPERAESHATPVLPTDED